MLYSAIILAAGKSERMNFPKAFLKNHEGVFFLEKIVHTLQQIQCHEIIVVVNQEIQQFYEKSNLNFNSKCKVILNHHLEKGRFYSLYMGANALEESDYCFVLNSDNPEIDKKLLKQLLNSANNDDYIVPVFNNKSGHPILLSNRVMSDIKNSNKYNIKLNEFLKVYKRKEVTIQKPGIHLNINTPYDYKKYLNNYNF